MEVKPTQGSHDSSSNLFLTGAILFANLDYGGLAEYALKAAIGGVIWMSVKLAADWVTEKMKRRSK